MAAAGILLGSLGSPAGKVGQNHPVFSRPGWAGHCNRYNWQKHWWLLRWDAASDAWLDGQSGSDRTRVEKSGEIHNPERAQMPATDLERQIEFDFLRATLRMILDGDIAAALAPAMPTKAAGCDSSRPITISNARRSSCEARGKSRGCRLCEPLFAAHEEAGSSSDRTGEAALTATLNDPTARFPTAASEERITRWSRPPRLPHAKIVSLPQTETPRGAAVPPATRANRPAAVPAG